MLRETATIVSAKYRIQNWQRKDGTIPEGSVPELWLTVGFKREGDEEGDRPYQEDYPFGSVAVFVPSTDGFKVNVRKSAIREGSPLPTPQKRMAAVRFLKSIKDAGGINVIEQIKKDGVKALLGLVVEVEKRKTPDMSERAKPVLLVNAIQGISKPAAPASEAAATTSTPTPTQTAVPEAPAAPGAFDADAQAALLAVLEKAGGSVARSAIATTLIQIDAWKNHKDRGDILKRMREDSFIASQNGVLWTLEGNTVKAL
jgi:hypothetical protein